MALNGEVVHHVSVHRSPFARLLTLAAACVLLLATGSPASAVEGADTQPPQLVTFEMTPDHVDISRASELVSVRMHVKDATGVAYAGVMVEYLGSLPGSINGFCLCPMDLVSGTARDGVWAGSYRMPQSSEFRPGEYRAQVLLRDEHLNRNEGLPAGFPHILTVTAEDAAAPDAPTGVLASAGTDVWPSNPHRGIGPGAAVVQWTAGSDNYREVSGYTVTASPGGQTCTTTHHECTVTGLTDGTSSTFTVTATNAIGTSPPSRPSNPVVPSAVPPTAPLYVNAYADEGKALLQWSSADGNGLPVTQYTVRSFPGGVTASVPGDLEGALQVEMTGLTAGTAYTFTVTASNSAGEGQPSPPSNHVLPIGISTWTPTDQVSARGIDGGCPADQTPDSGFADVAEGSAHARTVDCVAWWDVARGRTPAQFSPASAVTRGAMASFVARSIEAADPGSLPRRPSDAFADDDTSVHQPAINQLAAVGIVNGIGGGNFAPDAVVNRGQMARLLAQAAAHVLAQPLPADRDLFADDSSNPFQTDINRVASAGLTAGRSDGTYGADGTVSREQMSSFLSRSLDLYVAAGSGLTSPASSVPG